MADWWRKRASRALRFAMLGYAALLSLYVFTGFGELLDDLFGPPEARLFIISEAPLKNLRVTYNGNNIEPRPGAAQQAFGRYTSFHPLRARIWEPLLEVSWEAESGASGAVRRPMRQFSDKYCLYVLRIDALAVPETDRPDDPFSPFWWTCYFR
jgi:hypothetical protein